MAASILSVSRLQERKLNNTRVGLTRHGKIKDRQYLKRWSDTSVTIGDKDIVEFLTEEIKYEQKNEKKNLPKVNGFEITSTSGTNIELSKNAGNEKVCVKFNVNNTIDDDTSLEFKESSPSQEAEPQMVSRPPFIVEITKGGSSTLAMQCVFPADRFPGEEQPEAEYDDLIEIEEVALLDQGQNWEDAVYTLSGSNMDGNLYDMLLAMLEERGITEDFISELVELSTAFEHKTYVTFLQGLQNFVASK